MINLSNTIIPSTGVHQIINRWNVIEDEIHYSSLSSFLKVSEVKISDKQSKFRKTGRGLFV